MHTTRQQTPGQLVFGRDMIFNIKHKANLEYISQRKQDLNNKNNKRENAGRIEYEYKVGEKVLLKRGNENNYESPYQGPYEVLEVRDNGIVHLKVNSVTDTYNIQHLASPVYNRERHQLWGRMQYVDF